MRSKNSELIKHFQELINRCTIQNNFNVENYVHNNQEKYKYSVIIRYICPDSNKTNKLISSIVFYYSEHFIKQYGEENILSNTPDQIIIHIFNSFNWSQIISDPKKYVICEDGEVYDE